MLRQPRTSVFNGVPFTFPTQVFRVYLLDDEFTTTASAPLASPRTCEPGAGTLVVVQNDGQFSINGAALQVPAQTTPAWGDQGFYQNSPYTRIAGRAILTKIAFSNVQNGCNVAIWLLSAALPSSSQGNMAAGFGVNSAFVFAQHDGAMIIGSPPANGTSYQYALILRSQGTFCLIKGGVYSSWTLLFVDKASTNSPLYPGFNNFNAVGAADYFRVIDLPTPFDSDYGCALVHTSAVSGSDYAASATLIADVAITAPGALANTAGLKFRKNGTDYWQVWFDSSGNLLLQRFASGVGQGSPVTLASSVISASGTRTLRVIADGSAMDFFTLNGSTWTKQGATQTDSFLTANTGISPFADSGWSLGNVDAYARTSSQYNVLDTV